MVNENVPLMSENASTAPPYADPPSYDSATGSNNPFADQADHSAKSRGSQSYKPVPPPNASASYSPAGPSSPYGSPPVMVFHYQHPLTGDVVTTALPPDHPEMICLQEGRHITHSKFGILGILAAIVWFPFGIGLCLLDRRVVCSRCGQTIDDGFAC